MKTTIKYVAPWLAAAAIGGAVAFAPIAGAAVPLAAPTSQSVSAPDPGTDPLVPYGTEPQSPYRLGYIDPNHDEVNTTNGEIDVPF
jgi:hypothetical protein